MTYHHIIPVDYPSFTPETPSTFSIDSNFSVDLVMATQMEVKFLQKIDRETSMLYEPLFVKNALRRYETYWLPMQGEMRDPYLVPPLDVHWLWHTHMLAPLHYEADCANLVGFTVDHRLMSPEEIRERYPNSLMAWESFCGPNEPYDFVLSASKLGAERVNAFVSAFKYDLLAAAERQRKFNYQISLPHYTSLKFIRAAADRYEKFLYITRQYPDEFLTPCYDFDLVWHSHQVHPLAYAQDTRRIMHKLLNHDDSDGDRTTGSKLLSGKEVTEKLWQHHFPGEAFYRPGCMYRGHEAPFFMGFAQQNFSDVTCGQVRIPCITLKEVTARRDYLTLKWSYGSKELETFDIKLSRTVSTKNGISILGRYSQSLIIPDAPYGSHVSTAVKFQFDRNRPKYLTIDLKLFDRSFLQKKNVIQMKRTIWLEELLSPISSPSSHTSFTHTVTLESNEDDTFPNKSPSTAVRSQKAKLFFTISLGSKREVKLTLGEFYLTSLQSYRQLSDLCRDASLDKCQFASSTKFWLASHNLVDLRNNAQYVVRIVHSASALLSSVFVHGKDQKLLAMAHLISSDTLPRKTQLDADLQNVPNLSSSVERAMVVMNRDGDYAIIKARWVRFRNRVLPTKRNKGVRGNPGRLVVEAFNLLERTVHVFELPSSTARTAFNISGNVQAQLSESRIRCWSIYLAEQLACVFSVAILFVLCNPDRVRRDGFSGIAYPCHKWPLLMAAGYGQEDTPSNKYILIDNTATSSAWDNELAFTVAAMSLHPAQSDAGAACGSFEVAACGADRIVDGVGACGSGGACGISGGACGSSGGGSACGTSGGGGGCGSSGGGSACGSSGGGGASSGGGGGCGSSS